MLKYLPVVCLLIFAACTNPSTPSGESQSATATTPNSNIQFKGTTGAEVENEGFEKFDQSPSSAIPYFKKSIELFAAEDNYPKAALAFSNLASIYDQHTDQKDSALFYTEKSLEIWTQVKDELQIANTLKFRGRLKGDLGNQEEGIKDITEAIAMYDKLKYNQGAAVARFNLSMVYFRKRDYEKSIPLYEEGIKFWKSSGDNDRLFTNNLFGMELFHTVKDVKKVKAIIAENEKILKSTNAINKFNLNRFENLKGRLFLHEK